MGIDGDDLPFPPPDAHPSPIHQRKLKRLKKPSRVSEVEITLDSSLNPGPSDTSEALNSEDIPHADKIPDPERLVVDHASPDSRSVGFDKEMDSFDGLDPLFGDPEPLKEREALNTEQEMEEEDFESFREMGDGSKGSGETVDGLRKGKSAKKRLKLDCGEERPKKKKKTSDKGAAEDGKPKESVLNKRKLEKERKAYLEQLHAESQRLLRETRDASFKSVPLVQRPISSVLEKIRQRKQEMMKKSSSFYGSDSFIDADGSKSDSSNLAESESHGRGYIRSDKDSRSLVADANNYDISENHKSSRVNTHSEMNISVDSQHNNDENNQSVDHSNNLPAEREAPSLFAVSPKLDSDPLDDVSSDEEDFNKENIDPGHRKPLITDVYENSNPVKAFVDDEAEEEDDSDNDLMRFQEDEEDEEGDENEMPNDLIASGYKEMPIDHEKRNQLHQMWLEQQDAAATENVLQRLKYGQKQGDSLILNNEENGGKFSEDSADESFDNPIPANPAQQNSKRAKQMVAQMFTDVDDKYVSDEEETEQMLIRQRILEQTKKRASILSPVEDENSTEVFGLIKKLNIAPDPKRRINTTSTIFDTLIQGNSNSSSKSSFLGRAMSNSLPLPSSHKQGSIAVRSFIFGRDDSNSRSSNTISDDLSDMDQKENLPMKAPSARFSNSQSNRVRSKQKPVSESNPRLSLFETLRRSSLKFDQQLQTNQKRSGTITETQAVNQFTAFKLGKKGSKGLIQEA